MKKRILLLGEYSGVYTELAKELRKRESFDVFTINDGDGYKNYSADLHVEYGVSSPAGLFQRIWHYILYRVGFLNWRDFKSFWKYNQKYFAGYDVVQIINPVVFSEWGSIPNFIILKYLKSHNSTVYLSALGFDYYEIKYNRKHNNKSGFYTPRFKDFINPRYVWKYKYCLFYRMLNKYAVKISDRIIPGLLQYKLCYDWTGKTTPVVPFPISKSQIGSPIKIRQEDPILIFHGWQKGKESFKGNDVFDRVIRRVVEKYKEKVLYKIVQGVPYDEYLQLYNDAHLYIDQLYFPEKGTNAVLGMAKGKVVFSGFSPDSLRAYPKYSGEEIGVNASADESYLYEQFCYLIDNPQRIEELSKNAIEFVINNHESSVIANMYISIWGL